MGLDAEVIMTVSAASGQSVVETDTARYVQGQNVPHRRQLLTGAYRKDNYRCLSLYHCQVNALIHPMPAGFITKCIDLVNTDCQVLTEIEL